MSHTQTIKEACRGYKYGAVFELSNGQVWKQTSDQYSYAYQYRPAVEIDESRGTLRLEGMSDTVDVKRVKLLEQGKPRGAG
jgi:hypothetical protein